ncbi:unnamed protein product [Plasmodium vivax]|uniref:(malaria parasite P. vivax) hypothetical protein n=1 Tax=Plasmodium vivax TaxID=5855 RepID=A0A8S4HH70_PLAVI|nr:unnamed protein product [Plasmodium vivax]
MKTKKTARQSARQIAGRLKQIERECRQLSKHIRRVGEERKSFELTTALLKKYHSYVDSNLMNDLSIFPSSSAFVKSCGIVFSSKTVWEDPDGATEDGWCSAYAERRHSDCSMGGSHIIGEEALHGRSKHLLSEGIPPGVGYSDVCSSPGGVSPFGSNQLSGRKPQCRVATSPREGTSWSDCSGGTHGEGGGELGQKVRRKGRRREKKSSTVRPTPSYYSAKRGKTPPSGLLHPFEEHTNGANKEGTPQRGRHDERSVPNELSHFTVALRSVDQRRGEKCAASPLQPGGGQSTPRGGPHDDVEEDGDDNGDTVGQTDGKEEPHSRSPPDSCINSMGKGKVLSSFINKTESKCNPFYHFVSNVRRLFSLGEKEEEPNERGTTDEGKSERMTPFKFRCLVKAKRIVLYTCVCPQCEKNFYLLMRRSGRGKVAPRVLPPAQFAAVISHLREQRGGIPHMDIPHMDVAHLAPHEAGEHFCSCYVGMDEGGGGLFGDADVLAYL